MSQKKRNKNTSGESVAAEVVDGRINGRFAPGHSGNPAGARGKKAFEFTRIVQQRTDPEELYEILLAIARGQGVRVMHGQSYSSREPLMDTAVPVQMPGVRDQMKAIQMIAEWGFTKPPKQKQISIDAGRALPGAGFDESKLTSEQLAALAGILDSVRQLPSGDDED